MGTLSVYGYSRTQQGSLGPRISIVSYAVVKEVMMQLDWSHQATYADGCGFQNWKKSIHTLLELFDLFTRMLFLLS